MVYRQSVVVCETKEKNISKTYRHTRYSETVFLAVDYLPCRLEFEKKTNQLVSSSQKGPVIQKRYVLDEDLFMNFFFFFNCNFNDTLINGQWLIILKHYYFFFELRN